MRRFVHILLICGLCISCTDVFAQKAKHKRAARRERAARQQAAPLAPTTGDVSIKAIPQQESLSPPMKRRKKVVIVPAPPPPPGREGVPGQP